MSKAQKSVKFHKGDVVRLAAKQPDSWIPARWSIGQEFVVEEDSCGKYVDVDGGGWLVTRFELVRKSPESLKRVRLVITAKDFKEHKGWPDTKLHRAISRQVKKTCRRNIGATLGYIDDWFFDLDVDSMNKKYMASKTFHVYLDIPRKFLKNPN